MRSYEGMRTIEQQFILGLHLSENSRWAKRDQGGFSIGVIINEDR